MSAIATSTRPAVEQRTAERRPAAILIAELRNFTRMSEMLDPERVLELAAEFFSLVAHLVDKHGGGTLGTHNDSIMASFGLSHGAGEIGPAVKAAQEIQVEFGVLAERWQHDYGLQTAVAMGLHAGDTVFGMVGAGEETRYSAFGDTVTTAERLVHRARAGEFVFSEPVMRAITFSGMEIRAEELPPLELARRPTLKLYGVLLDTRLDFT